MKIYPIMSTMLYQRGAFAHLGDKVETLRRLGVEVVVCCITPYDADLEGVVEYVHVPFADGQLRNDIPVRTAALVADRIKAGRPVLVHCRGGRNRSALVSALTIRELTGCTGAEALARVRRARPGALANEHFARYLHELAAPAYTSGTRT
jgi:protein-tyrosine phosphatase